MFFGLFFLSNAGPKMWSGVMSFKSSSQVGLQVLLLSFSVLKALC